MDRISLWGALKGQEKNMLCNVIATRNLFLGKTFTDRISTALMLLTKVMAMK